MFVFYPGNHGNTATTLFQTEVPKNDESKSIAYLFFEFYAQYLDAKRRTPHEFIHQRLLRVYRDLKTIYSSRESSHLDR